MSIRRPSRSRLESDLVRLEAPLGPLPPAQARPALIVLVGLPASGKTYLAGQICRRYPLARLESDALRRALFPRPSYSQLESSRLFAAVHVLIRKLLQRGVPVVLDATNLKEAHRRPLRQIAEEVGAEHLVIRVLAPDRVAKARLVAKLRGDDPDNRSEADLAVYDMMRREQEPISGPHLVVDTSGNTDPFVDKIVTMLEQASG